jgi:crotonobetaine/carnitine-CoA ligase
MGYPLDDLLGQGRATVPQVLEARARTTPDLPFMHWEDDTWSYAQCWEDACRLSGFLLDQGLGGLGKRVASFIENSPRCMITWWGVQASGAAYVPINLGHRGALLSDMLTRSGAELLVADAASVAHLPDLEECGITAVLVLDGPAPVDAAIASYSWADVEASAPRAGTFAGPRDVAEVMYTSGTTGRSKAVMIPHNQICRGGARLAATTGMRESDVFHAWQPMFHLAGQLDVVMPVMVSGASFALLPGFSTSRFWEQVQRYDATFFMGFTNLLEILMNMPERDDDADCPLRAGIIGGVPAKLCRGFETRFGVQLHDAYGMTEAEPLTVSDASTPPGSCGRATADYEVAIVDAEDNFLEPGQEGEIVARPNVADVMMLGYENDAEATAKAFRNLWLHTGDLGHLDADGYLYFKDRIKHAIRRRGENISSWELENLVRDHPDVDECVAVAVPSPLGEDDVKVVVIARAGANLEAGSLHDWCRDKMARFMVPRYIELRTEVPLTGTGKVRKELLRDVSGDQIWDAEVERPSARSTTHARS